MRPGRSCVSLPMKTKTFLLALAFLSTLAVGVASAEPDLDPSCYSVEVDQPNGQPPTGVRVCP